MRALDRKLARDLWHYRSPLAAITAVVICGVALFVTLRSMNGYLRLSRDRFYADYRFADVFASLKRAPDAEARAIARRPFVRVVTARIIFEVTLDVPRLAEPALGRLVSIPVPREAGLNELHLMRGRWPERSRPNEAIASAAFSDANGLVPGDSIGAIVNGRWERLAIVGVGVSPEYVYEIGGSAIFPDNRRFGVLWMGHDALADAFDMGGAFNDLAIGLAPGASEREAIAEVDRELAPYGAAGAYPRADQLSNQFLNGEIEETQVTSILLPGIFLAVTAFLLHVVLSRLVATQREQIAVLKAFGYSNASVGAHYLLLALAPILLGVVAGVLLGLRLASGLAVVYGRFFQFPPARFTPDWRVVVAALVVTAAAGLAGALGAVWRCVRLPPAEAMRPEAPSRFRRGLLERLRMSAALSPAARIVARNLARRPGKTALSVLALGFAVGIVILMGAMYDAIEYMKEVQFHQVSREDLTVTFDAPRPEAAASALSHLPGVAAMEPFRAVPVRLHARVRSHRTVIVGLPSDGRLHRIVDEGGDERRPPRAGLLCSGVLAAILGVKVGDRLTVDVLEGRRAHPLVEVVGISNELLGATAYMEIGALGGLMREAPAVSGAYLRIDPRFSEALYLRLKHLPAVRSVGVRAAELESFQRTIAESFTISLTTAMVFACVIAFGIVYNGARISLSERGRELASLRVLGFSFREVTSMLLGEQGVLVLLAIPAGFAIAYGLSLLIAVRFQSELFRIPIVTLPRTYVFGAAVVALSAVASGFAVRGRVSRLDLVAVLKTRA
jgi:putative ABC transport system permease protein